MGWISCISVVFNVFFSKLFCCMFVYFCFVLMFSPSLFKLLHLQSKNTYNNITTHKQVSITKKQVFKNKHLKKQKYIISQPETEIYLFAVGSRAGSLTMERNPLL